MDIPINNFKGVMLCNRPNENVMPQKDKPFCSRVQPYDQWGLTKKFEEPQQKAVSVNPVLERHKRWLEEFKLQNKLKKHAQDEQMVKDEEKFVRVRELAKKDREVTKKMKEEYRTMNDVIQQELKSEQPKTVKLTTENLKKLEEKETKEIKNKKRYKSKPVWAMTKEEEEEHFKEEEDELLKFVENLDYDQYLNDLEVNVMVKALQQRVGELKKDENWKEKAQKQQDQQDQQDQQEREQDIYDKISQSLGKNDEAKSVNSEKSMESINQLRKKQEGKAEWEKSTISDKKTPIEDRIAKHVADEILRQYKNLNNVHSNSSIRKILEREAKKTLQESGIPGPLISTIKNEKRTQDPNTLPYLHRNPAI